MLHMEIVQERLEREFDMTVITTVPNVSYHAYTNKGKMIVNNPPNCPRYFSGKNRRTLYHRTDHYKIRIYRACYRTLY